MTKSEIIRRFKLQPLAIEGGYFAEVYRSTQSIDKQQLGNKFNADNYTASTSIYYLLGATDLSSLHSVSSDETWHFYGSSDSGVYIDLLLISPDYMTSKMIKLGSRFDEGQVGQYTIPGGWIMGAKISSTTKDPTYTIRNGSWVLSGATVAPSFEYADFKKIDPKQALEKFPAYTDFL